MMGWGEHVMDKKNQIATMNMGKYNVDLQKMDVEIVALVKKD
jgi:hypothetical protein